MKKFIFGLVIASMFAANPAMADRQNHNPPRRDHHAHHHHGGRTNPWAFITGAVIGGIIVKEAIREEYSRPQRYINVCEDLMLYDRNGRYVKTERYCRQELVPAY